jgi:Na+/melibiose symporter-like transporter
VIISLFILWERRVKEPLLDLRFFGNARFSTGIAILIIMGLALNGVMYVLTYYLQIIHGYTPLSAGLRFIPAAFGMLLGAISADKLVLRFGQKAVMTAGFIGTAAVLFVFSMLKVDSSFWLLGTEEAFFGVFLGFVVAPVTNIIMSNLPKEKTGLGSAINSSFRQIAGTLGVAVLGGILGSVYSSHFLKAAVNINSLPAVLVQKASDSVGVAMGIVRSGQLHGALADKLSLAAKDSFMDGWRVIMLICSCIFIVGAVIVLKFVPSRKEINTDDIGSKEHLEHHAGL